MTQTDFVEVCFGHSRWMLLGQLLISLLGFIAVVTSPASLAWKLGCIFLLIPATAWTLLQVAHTGRSGTIRLFQDNTAVMHTATKKEFHLVRGNHGWISRWLSVLPLIQPETGKKYFCVICASENHPDDYRRLLITLRMSADETTVQKVIW